MKLEKLKILFAVLVVIGFGFSAGAQEEQTAEPAAEAEAPAETETPAEPEAPADPNAPFETTVDIAKNETIKLGGTVGKVDIRDVEFIRVDLKKGVVGGAFGSSNDDLKSKFKVRLSCATEAGKKQKIRVKVEFLDGDGTVIDRLVQDVNLKNEAKIFEFEQTILTWVVPHITQASITVARND